jgi:Transposase IS200 like
VPQKNDLLELRPQLGEVFRRLAQQKESRIEEGHLPADHVHMLISIRPKYAVSQVVGFITCCPTYPCHPLAPQGGEGTGPMVNHPVSQLNDPTAQ